LALLLLLLVVSDVLLTVDAASGSAASILLLLLLLLLLKLLRLLHGPDVLLAADAASGSAAFLPPLLLLLLTALAAAFSSDLGNPPSSHNSVHNTPSDPHWCNTSEDESSGKGVLQCPLAVAPAPMLAVQAAVTL
jgi:hypothetical protein